MSKYKKIHIQSINTNVPDQKIHTSVTYNMGGHDYFNGGMNRRGFYLHVTPVTDKGDGCISFLMGAGYKHLLLEVPRFNERQFQQTAAGVSLLPLYEQMIERVLAETKLTRAA